MRVEKLRQIIVTLDAEQQFTAADDYSEKRVEVRADHLNLGIDGDVWATGRAYRKDHTLGDARRTVLTDLEKLPKDVLAQIVRELVD
jgi:hypothetical protein